MAPKHVTRSEWAQIVKRVKQVEFKFDAKWKCLLCGRKFTSAQCEHSTDENESVILEVQKELAS